MVHLYEFLGKCVDFVVAKRFMLRYYTERFTIVGRMAAYESARQTQCSRARTSGECETRTIGRRARPLNE